MFGLGVEDYGVAPADVVAIEGLEGVDLILLGSSGSKGEINDGEFLFGGVGVLDALEGLAVFLQFGLHEGGVGDDILELSDCAEFLLAFCALDWVALVLVFDLLVGVGLHLSIMIVKE